MDRIKVVWLCHFSNAEIQSLLKPWKQVHEYAPWIPPNLKLLEGDARFDVYVIAPHEYIGHTHTFDLRGIHYLFYNPYIPFWGRHWPGFFRWDYISNFARNKRIVKKWVDKIKPDVVHLQGAENPYYSAALLPLLNKYPTILTVQGFFSHSPGGKTGYSEKRAKIEREILSKIRVSFYETRKMAQDIRSFNPSVKLYWNTYTSIELEVPEANSLTKYDMVFFARISKAKGIEDLLKATAILKHRNPNISLCVIGGGNSSPFQQLSAELGIAENVHWAGFLPTQKDVYRLALQARVSVLPTYYDIIPGTIVESMFLGIPVVSYKIDSIPEINEGGEVISLVEKGDIEGLAQAIEQLLDDEALRTERIQLAKKRANEMFVFSNETITNSLLVGYQAAISEFDKTH